jgi:hypothetical protein
MKSLLSIGMIIVLFGCGPSQAELDKQKADEALAAMKAKRRTQLNKASKKAAKKFKESTKISNRIASVKNIHIGSDLDWAFKRIMDIVPKDYESIGPHLSTEGKLSFMNFESPYYLWIGKTEPEIESFAVIMADSNKKICKMNFTGRFMNDVFSSYNLTVVEFARKIVCGKCAIPKLKPTDSGWTYYDQKNGYVVFLDEHKGLIFIKGRLKG